MTAYCVFVVKRVKDRAKLEQYWANVRAALEGVPIKMLGGYGDFVVLEGDEQPVTAVIAEFPDVASAQSWHASETYAPWLKLRLEAAEFSTFVIEGGMPPASERLPGI